MRNILLTSLNAVSIDLPIRHFSIRNGSGVSYCEAFLNAEASIKAVLSRHDIDEIIVIGREDSYNKGDELNTVSLRHGSTLSWADKTSISTYALLQYRIAKYADNLPADQTEEDEGLSEEVGKKLIRFIRDFQERNPELTDKKLNRLFDLLTRNDQLCEKFWYELFEACPELSDNPGPCTQWIKSYLYAELDPSAKMEILPANKEALLRFIPEAKMEDSGQWVDSMTTMKKSIMEDQEDINLYVSLCSDDAVDTFVLLNMLDILVTMPGSGVHLKKIFTLRNVPNRMTGIISDDTSGFGITELFHGIRSFLNYGKADMIADIWKKSGEDNEHIAGMVYAMRDVDVGLSMCNISDVERGILRLRELFMSEEFWRASGYYGMMFSIIAESIREDYGALLIGSGRIPFLDLVKWAYRHQFYQQTLTLIESKAPEELVRQGIFYYCGDEMHKDQVTRLFAEKRLELKPHEYYKIDDIEHYFIKTYDRIGVRSKGIKGENLQHAYAILRTQSIENKDPSQITGLTACDSMETLQNLLYAYYHIGEVRNKINHADSNAMAKMNLLVSKSGDGSALSWVTDAIDFFIDTYEKALAEVQGKKPNVIIITGSNVRKTAEQMKHNNPPQNRRR